MMPSVGDVVFGFRLRRELGAGTFGRAFLADHAEMGGAALVVKISAGGNSEPRAVARLKHRYIVPIHGYYEDAEAGLLAVCMPYIGGANLARVLAEIWRQSSHPRLGSELLSGLKNAQASDIADAAAGNGGTGPPIERRTDSPLDLLTRCRYPDAVAWLVACLAEGLDHAHRHGILHRDIKPSNILIAANGVPLLLDFNLCKDMRDTGDRPGAPIGGTLAYMAPEHLRAMAFSDPALDRRVGRGADIYSLGLVLFEMLVGHKPFDPGSHHALPAQLVALAAEREQVVPSARERRADVPWNLESIIRRCLHPDPAARYQQADHLAEDLRAVLNDRELIHAPELSLADRIRRWFIPRSAPRSRLT